MPARRSRAVLHAEDRGIGHALGIGELGAGAGARPIGVICLPRRLGEGALAPASSS